MLTQKAETLFTWNRCERPFTSGSIFHIFDLRLLVSNINFIHTVLDHTKGLNKIAYRRC